MKDKFMDMVKVMDMSFSYKPVLLKAMSDHADENGKVGVGDVVDYFIEFYSVRKNKGLVVEKKKLSLFVANKFFTLIKVIYSMYQPPIILPAIRNVINKHSLNLNLIQNQIIFFNKHFMVLI